MQLTSEFAKNFADEWINAWNAHDLNRIMKLYASDIVFHSAGISIVMQNDKSSVKGTAALTEYWRRALELLPELCFQFKDLMIGSDALTIMFSDDRGQSVAETFIFNDSGLVYLSLSAKK